MLASNVLAQVSCSKNCHAPSWCMGFPFVFVVAVMLFHLVLIPLDFLGSMLFCLK